MDDEEDEEDALFEEEKKSKKEKRGKGTPKKKKNRAAVIMDSDEDDDFDGADEADFKPPARTLRTRSSIPRSVKQSKKPSLSVVLPAALLKTTAKKPTTSNEEQF